MADQANKSIITTLLLYIGLLIDFNQKEIQSLISNVRFIAISALFIYTIATYGFLYGTALSLLLFTPAISILNIAEAVQAVVSNVSKNLGFTLGKLAVFAILFYALSYAAPSAMFLLASLQNLLPIASNYLLVSKSVLEQATLSTYLYHLAMVWIIAENHYDCAKGSAAFINMEHSASYKGSMSGRRANNNSIWQIIPSN